MNLLEQIKKAGKWAGALAIPAAVTWMLDRAAKLFASMKLRMQVSKNRENREQLEKAQTPEERDAAARKITDSF